jgi:hypothetical protein
VADNGRMTDYAAVTRTVQRFELDANAVLKQAWLLYKRLFARSVLLAGTVYGATHFLQAIASSGRTGVGVTLVALVLSIAGLALVQGGLVEIVRGLHEDGDDDASVFEALGRASGRVMKLVCVSLLFGLGVGLASLLLVIPGLIVAVRWAVAVPAAMLEEGNARAALGRSRALVAGNGWNVFKVLFAVGMLNLLVLLPLTLVAHGSGPFGIWVATTIGSALTAPYAAHALTVVYYALVQPGRPVVLDPGRRWESVWSAEGSEPEQPATAWDEYERQFDEREQRWS